MEKIIEELEVKLQEEVKKVEAWEETAISRDIPREDQIKIEAMVQKFTELASVAHAATMRANESLGKIKAFAEILSPVRKATELATELLGQQDRRYGAKSNSKTDLPN